MEESDEREGFSVGGVNVRVGSTREGGTSGGVIERLPVPVRERVGLENGVRVRDEAAVPDPRDKPADVSVEFLELCSEREVDDACEIVEFVDERRVKKEESSVYAVHEGSASVDCGREKVGGEGIVGGK